MVKTIFAVYDSKSEARQVYSELMQNGFFTKYLPIGKQKLKYSNNFSVIKRIAKVSLSGLVLGFLFGGLIGFFDGVTSVFASFRSFLFGIDLFNNLSLVQLLILSWGLSTGIISMIISGVLATIFPENQIIEMTQEREEVVIAVPVSESQEDRVETILESHGPVTVGAL
ncbi:MAG: hypothetical protein US86_C0001G0279 [Candidatus Daviesbacteria bacterium GW2011_GWA2_38_24]|uniref:Uncharacterized protein n=1 Tax=Candidatus Daviesbacteria bacterium GW2011_GWA2_38_24 TaxID=1618422 RepID=A0A0G0JKG5_9BACT|nr:MAG: hypothetical protein US86_C0001G0279 [Candidatus Daviesbacteria bacterium GW2011_GWA2_38_24]KKQ78647.1 MAG: hypothetical protein UT01_C0064G0019 [Candidatus Daviesbacteria bacterium GW2011_GWA1_38_7]OGE23621.1 MAG: hypothetical protein A2688_00460 [Candidatus Daviesbacteria bacterium RIFCSPHIGHO2_01_FULL_38_8]